jgi:hypothetical protein
MCQRKEGREGGRERGRRSNIITSGVVSYVSIVSTPIIIALSTFSFATASVAA